jgi:hypothetical protein
MYKKQLTGIFYQIKGNNSKMEKEVKSEIDVDLDFMVPVLVYEFQVGNLLSRNQMGDGQTIAKPNLSMPSDIGIKTLQVMNDVSIQILYTI